MERIKDAIADLPEQERLAITLTYIDGYTTRQCGTIMNVSQTQVMRLRRSAITTLRRELAE
jgi:RNA polymerase sigma factor (sigma-70 family)